MPKKSKSTGKSGNNGIRNDNGNGGTPLSQIQDFYKFMVDQSLETLEYDHGDLHVRMVRRKAAVQQVPVPIVMGAAPAGVAPAAASGAASAPAGMSNPVPRLSSDPHRNMRNRRSEISNMNVPPNLKLCVRHQHRPARDSKQWRFQERQ